MNGIEELEGEKDATLIIRSHGVPREVLQKLEEQEIHYVDATCPFVKKYMIQSKNSAEEGYEILIIGNRTHPEVKGYSWLDKRQWNCYRKRTGSQTVCVQIS